ncbi:MAG: hypothetical protein WC878_08005 [Candidatus Paceibacterota bacterium]|jgi:hypothetical protein
MINNELLSFIKERRSQGETKEQITDMLVAHGGWDKKDVEEAFETIDISGTSMPSMVGAMQMQKDAAASLQKADMTGPVITPLVVTTSPAPATATPAPVQPATPAVIINNPPSSAPIAVSSLVSKTAPATPIIVSVATPAPAPITTQSKPAEPATPTTAVGAIQTPAPSAISSAPKTTTPEVAPKTAPAKTLSSFFGIKHTQISKTLEPSAIAPLPEPLVHSEVQGKTASPIPSSMMGGAGTGMMPMTAEPKADDTLQNLKAKFTEGKIVSPTPAEFLDASAKDSLLKSKPASVSGGGIGFPKTSPGVAPIASGLSQHMQSGMVPSGKVSPSPIVPTVKPVVPTVPPLAPFQQGQKMPSMGGMGAGIPQFSKPAQLYPTKVPGRKLLGFFMFATGIVCGAVAMHAYLNGYFDPAILWVTAMTGQAPAVPTTPL